MSVSIEKLKKQIDRLKSAEHKLSVHEDALPRCARNGGSPRRFDPRDDTGIIAFILD